jgi:hypothetical protein
MSLHGPSRASQRLSGDCCGPHSFSILLVLLLCTLVGSRVVDPYSFFPDPDPDPEFDVGDQYGSGSNPDPGL